MTLFLASVRNAEEAALALAAGADVIDLKEPLRGALGAVEQETLRACVRQIAGAAILSATTGDLPMHAATLSTAVRECAQSGIDYVKLGVFPEAGAREALETLAPIARETRLILVLFADALPSFDAIPVAAAIGARGVMLDTMRKDGTGLLRHLARSELASFVGRARSYGLLAGLAGSLHASDIEGLLELKPDLLGFRGALCLDAARGATLDPARCAGIRRRIPKHPADLRGLPSGGYASAMC